MKNYLVRICLLLTACTLLLTACGTEGTKLPDLSTLGKVVAIAREEGSGTRAEFDTMLSTNQAAADAVAASTIDVLQQVGQEKNAIGYLAHSTLSQKLAQEYMQQNPRAQVSVVVTDSSSGLTSAIRRECDLAISSRELKSYEKELLTSKAFARDAIVLIVNKQNPINNLSTKQIKALYETCNEWKSLNLGREENKKLSLWLYFLWRE